MGNFVGGLSRSLGIIKEDKVIVILSSVPVMIGIALYYFLGSWVFGDLLPQGQEYIETKIAGSMGGILYYIFVGILSILLVLFINWTFVITVSLLGCPFNDLISRRVEAALGGRAPESLSASIRDTGRKLFKIIWNELKKIMVIVSLSLIALALSFSAILSPISVFLSAILLAISFLDYSWSRHEFTFRQCLSDIRGGLITYILGGGLFLVLTAIPVLNLFFLPFGVVYFTLLFHEKQKALS